MNIDMDEYLDQYEIDPQSTQGPPNNMNDVFQNRFELDPFSFHHSHDDNQGLDVFSNNNGSGNGGQGSLSYFGNEEQQHFFDSSGLDGHFSAPNSQDGHDQHQLANSSSFDSHYSHQGAQRDQDPTTGQVEDTADSLEHDNTVLEEEEVDVGPLKNEERDSDDEFEEDDEDKEVDEEAEDGEDGQKKKTKRKPYSDSRSLIRWHTGKDQLALMALIYELEMRGIQVPYGRVCRHVQADCAEKGDAMIQHLTKARKARIYYGLPVPPPLPSKKKFSKDGKNTTDELGQVSEKDIKMWNTLTYTRPGRDDQSDGTPGTMPPEYTPVMIPGKPHLSHYDYTAESTMNMPPWPETPPPKAPRAPKTASAPSKKKGKQTVKQDADKEESAPAASTEKKGRSSRKAVKAEQDGDATYSEKPTRKAQRTPAATKRKTAAKPATKATPSKPRGVTKSKKTPATLSKKMSGLSVHSTAALEQTATPSKKPGASKKKAKVNVAPVLEEPTASEPTPVAINNAEQSTQSYGRVSREAPGMPAQSFEHMLADLLPENFQMGRHQASQSFGSQSTMSTVPSQSMLDNSAQFMPNNVHVPMQNSYSGHSYHSNGYSHHTMPNHNLFFAHGHGASAMIPGGKEQDIQHLGLQGQGGYPMQQYNNNYGYNCSNVHNYGPGPHGLGIMHDGTLLPREPIQLDPELSNYSFDSGANNMTAQQQLFSNDDFQMQTNNNDIKPDMDQHMGDFTDMSGFEDGSNIFNDVEQTTLYH